MITMTGIGYMGQLGNQMYQYAALLGISQLHGYEVVLPGDNREIRDVEQDYTGRKIRYGLYLLNCFDLTERVLSSTELNQNLQYRYHEAHHHFDENVLRIPDNTGIIGHLESYRYFDHARKTVLEKMKFKPEIKTRAEERFKKYQTKSVVSLHVRTHTRYTTEKFDHHCFLPVEYYRKALTFFPEQDYNILVFTDNFPWVKENIKGPNIYYNEYDTEYSRPDFIDLCMMSFCDHHIIANSSFSWWGAYLANKKDQVVIAPSQWFGPAFAHLSDKDTVPPRWIRI